MRTPPIFWLVCCLHAAWGLCLLASADPLGITALYVLRSFNHFAVGSTLLASSALAALRIYARIEGRRGFALLLPQELLLSTSAIGAAYRAYIHAYADGVPRPFFFIMPDQLPIIAIFVIHSAMLVYQHREGRWSLQQQSR